MTKYTADGTAFEETGNPAGPAVVLIHGLGLNKDVWRWTTGALSAGYRVVTYDLYGHGDSPNPPQTPDLELFSSQLCGLLDHLGIKSAAIVGFSLGGMIARRFSGDHPERATCLGILNSPHKRSAEAQTAILARVDQAAISGPAATVEAALDRWFTESYRIANPDVMDLVRSWVMANTKDVYPTIYKVLADGIDEIVAPNPSLAGPALVLTGDEDYGNGPEMSAAIAAEIPDAELVILKGLRHMALAEDPKAVNDPLVSFLNRTFVEE